MELFMIFCHGSKGCGGLNLKGPVGGLAYGIPRNSRTSAPQKAWKVNLFISSESKYLLMPVL